MTIALVQAADLVDDMLLFARQRLIKAARPVIERQQQKLLGDATPEMAKDLAAYFERFASRALPKVAKAVAIKWDPDDIDWDVEEDELGELFARWYVRVGTSTYELIGEQVGAEVAWNLNARGVKNVLDAIGTRVQGINDTSRDALRRMVGEATERGLSIDELVRGLPDSGFGGLRDMVSGWASTDPGGANSRAQTIAATETANAYSLASVNAYRDSGLIDQVEAADGEGCGLVEHEDDDYPDGVDGLLFDLDTADEYPTAHPNCSRAWLPIAAR